MTRLARFDIFYDTRFARMCATDDFALSAVLKFLIWIGFHNYLYDIILVIFVKK